MTDPEAAQRAREWLERQLADLGQLRNASRRDHNFKTWRQQTLTVIQRIWPGESRRVDRFRRIPFSPPSAHSTERQTREYFERGWGEAGVLLRDLIGEINLLGLPQIPPAGAYSDASDDEAMGPIPMLSGRQSGWPSVVDPPDPGPPPLAPADDHDAGDDIGRAMDRLLGTLPALRAPAPLKGAGFAPEPGTPAAELMRLAGELEALGLSPARASSAREALLALARAAQSQDPAWELVDAALRHAGATPALAQRLLPVLLELVAKAA